MTVPLANSWSEARAHFRQAARRCHAALWELPIDDFDLDGARLAIDVAWIGAARPERALVHLSGVHGVEGYAGSRLQCYLLGQLATPPHGVAAIFVHGVNPFGMAHLRRWNEQNVDLNRNFLAPDEPYQGADPLYDRLARLLDATPRGRHYRFPSFVLRLLWYACRWGWTRTAQAIAGGQYTHPQGLFFGGHGLQAAARQLLAWMREHLADCPHVRVIDQHTGLGRWSNSMVLRSDPGLNSQAVDVRPASREVTYRAKGELIAALQRELPSCRQHALIQEIGTHSMVYLLYLLREENQCWHSVPPHDHRPLWSARLREAFCPTSAAWQQALLTHGSQLWQTNYRAIGGR